MKFYFIISTLMWLFTNIFKIWFKAKENGALTKQNEEKRKILVISWWGFRWTYAMWILKAMEEFWIDKEIDAIFWVSIGAIVWSSWANWIKADDIFWRIKEIGMTDFYSNELLKLRWWGFISNKKISKILNEYLPENFESLKIPFYAWCVDTNSATYQLFSSWDLRKIVLWSMSIPWVFSPVSYENFSLVDGGVLNNFPVEMAKEKYPNHEIIWIALNKFETNQKIKTPFDNLRVNFSVILRAKIIENVKLVDTLFYRDLPISVLSLSKKQMQQAFDLWYKDWVEMFRIREK